MKYNGKELKPVTEPQVYKSPKKMLVWDSQDDNPTLEIVYAITTEATYPVVINSDSFGVYDARMFCAEIPEEPKPRMATNREVAKWLSQGNGEYTWENGNEIRHHFFGGHCYVHGHDDEPVDANMRVRKWEDTEWHEPTIDYLGIKEG